MSAGHGRKGSPELLRFVMVGLLQIVLCFAALGVRLLAPGNENAQRSAGLPRQ